MRKIEFRDAKASLSDVVDAAAQGKPALITRGGKPKAVVLSFEEYKRLSAVPSFARLLMSVPIGMRDVKRQDKSRLRDIDPQ